MSINEISDTTWIYLIEDLLKHRDVMATRGHLSPFVEDFEGALGDLKESVGDEGADDATLERLKHETRLADDEHDDAHRALFRLMEAFGFHGSEADRATVSKALEALYPEKLSIITASFSEEIGATEKFASKLGDATVKAGLAIIGREVPAISEWTQRCLNSGRALGDTIRALESQQSRREVAQEHSASDLITTLGQVRRLWRLFMQTMDFAYPTGVTEHDELREQLLGRYFREVTG